MAVPTTPPRLPPLRKGDEATLVIDSLAYGGRGVGRVDGFVVFVPDTAPGDHVRVRVWRVKRGYAEADLAEVERPSSYRTPPPCPHFGPCGGCIWQHISYPAQLEAKQAIIQDSLGHMAGLQDVEVRPILGMASPWHYRNKMEFTFHPDGLLGLHRRGAFDKVVTIDTCLLHSPRCDEILKRVREFAVTSGLSRYDPRDHSGLLRQLVLREGKATGEIMVGVITTAREVPGLRALAEQLVAEIPSISCVVHGINPGMSDGLPLAGVSALAGRPYIIEELAGLRFRIGVETFFQTNTAQASRLIDVVDDLAALGGGETVYDLYCGVGTFSLALARRAGHVHGIEVSAAAVGAARENADDNGIANAEFVAGDVRRMLPEVHSRVGRPDLVVLDPPRGGAGTRVMRRVIATDTPRIIYVSCNPTTLAPDLRDLVAAGYAIQTIQPLDLFPHTYHVECAALLERGASPTR